MRFILLLAFFPDCTGKEISNIMYVSTYNGKNTHNQWSHMDCRDMILSNEFADILFDFDLENTDETVEQCTVNVDQNFNIVYARRSQIPTAIREWNYPFLPKCYGLLEPNTPSAFSTYNQLALIDAGILSVQSQPLNLTGKGVLIGFLDTGINIRLFWICLGTPAYIVSGIRPFRQVLLLPAFYTVLNIPGCKSIRL